jgi:septum formation protein
MSATIVFVSAPGLYLASTSPRRRMLLEQAGLPFELCEPGPELDHVPAPPGTLPSQLAVDRARRKALGAVCLEPRVPVLGVDTVVELDGGELGKPRDRVEAESMLRQLSDRTHRVHTAHCLVVPASGVVHEELASARVACGAPPAAELQRYLDSNDWVGKAGAYGIQDPTQGFLRVVEGEFDTVMGLHVAAVQRLLALCRSPA